MKAMLTRPDLVSHFFITKKLASGEIINCLRFRLSKDEELAYFKQMLNFDVTSYLGLVKVKFTNPETTIQFGEFKCVITSSDYHTSCYKDNTKNPLINDCISAMIYTGIIQ